MSDLIAHASDEFSRAFGTAFMAWGTVEQQLFFWFLYITKADIRVARAIYYSFNGFDGRANMVESVAAVAKIEEDERAFLLAAVKKAKNFSQFRNRLGHGEPLFDYSVDNDPPARIMLANGRHEFPDTVNLAVTIEKLEFASVMFSTLAAMLMQSRFKRDSAGPMQLEEFRVRVRALPKQEDWDKEIQSLREA